MRRIVTTAVAVALMGGAALSAPAVAADTDRPTGPGSAGVLSPGDLLELTPEAPLPAFGEPTATDALNERKKGRAPIFTQRERLAIVGALKVVDQVFVEESLEQKRDYIVEHGADVLVMGDDWAGKFDEFDDVCEVVYLERTPAISTTALIEKISATSV